MSYEFITKYNAKCFTPGRPYGSPTSMTLHWWDLPERNPTFDGVVQMFVSGSRSTSAHYVVEAGRVACLVSPDDRAWACGDGINVRSGGNDLSISIECNPRQSDGDYETIAELVRNIRKAYGFDLPIYPHSHWTATSCPGTYDIARIDRMARGMGLQPAKPAPAPAKPAPAKPAPAPALPKVAVDGSIGPDTVRLWQRVMGTQVDGVISGQVVPDGRTYGRPALHAYQYGRGGSNLVRAVQRQLGIAQDGLLGPATIRAIQAHLGVAQDGWLGPGTARALQERLNTGRF